MVCNGHAECLDQSDENQCTVAKQALEDVTNCGDSSQIISKNLMCDGKPDCFNDFDEENCPRCSSGLSAFKYGPKEQCFLSNSKCPENSVTNIILKLAKSIESTGHEYALEDLKPWVPNISGGKKRE